MEIKNSDLDLAIDYFESKQFSDSSEKEFISKFPVILSYLTSNQFDILSEEEYMILMFEAIVLLKAIENKQNNMDDAEGAQLEALETKNWDKFESFSNMSFEEKTDKLFDNKNEDIVDFILSGFESDEDEYDFVEISSAAKEILLISLKTIYDSFI